MWLDFVWPSKERAMPDPTDAEVEWCAEWMWDLVEKHPGWTNRPIHARKWSDCEPYYRPIHMDLVRECMAHGLRPPPRPTSVREELAALIGVLTGETLDMGDPYRHMADAILARFDVRRKDV